MTKVKKQALYKLIGKHLEETN